ncbi:MAG: LysM peptidoglycan-binding domain-containing protein [Bacilli bacterium]|nr:LysM peptidoglycan-binding domain-containing protein [Bacilli bacterium]
MKQTIPFTKDITFKTKIGEIISISLDNDLMLKGEDLISGNFYINGSYKMIETSALEETYSYKIPCEIAISDEYDTFHATVDIDDFHYEIIDDEVLRINIVLVIDNLQKKEKEEIKEEKEAKEEEVVEVLRDDDRCIEEEKPEITSFLEVQESIKKQSDTYLTYKVYIFKEGDSIDSVLEKYNITKDDLGDYNDLDSIKVGSKIVIPSFND